MIVILVCLLLLAVILGGMPIALAFGGAGYILSFLTGNNTAFHLAQGVSQISGFALLALPMFIMAGSIMSEGGISTRLLDFVEALIGRSRQSTGTVTIVACALFGAISGSAAAAIAAIGRTMIPRMVNSGYDKGYATALVACSSVLSLLIPPSIPMIVFAITSGVSVSAAFLSTILPGILLAIFYVALNWRYITNGGRYWKDIPETTTPNPQKGQSLSTATLRAAWSLGLPIVVLGGIYSGLFTPTEAAAVSVFYALTISVFVHKSLTFGSLLRAFRDGVATTGQIVAVLFFLFIFTRAIVLEQAPEHLSEYILAISTNKIAVLLLINLALLLIGMIVDDISGSILAAIVLLPIAANAGIDPVHFAAIVGTNLGLGNVSPPCAPLLFMAGGVAKQQLTEYIGPAFRLLVFGHLPVVLIVTFVPELALWLPNQLLGG